MTKSGDSISTKNCILVKDENSIDYKSMPSDIKIAPNPAKEYINVEFTKYDILDMLTIFDANGKKLKEERNFLGGTIDISSLSSGIYFVVCRIGNDEYSQKLIIE